MTKTLLHYKQCHFTCKAHHVEQGRQGISSGSSLSMWWVLSQKIADRFSTCIVVRTAVNMAGSGGPGVSYKAFSAGLNVPQNTATISRTKGPSKKAFRPFDLTGACSLPKSTKVESSARLLLLVFLTSLWLSTSICDSVFGNLECARREAKYRRFGALEPKSEQELKSCMVTNELYREICYSCHLMAARFLKLWDQRSKRRPVLLNHQLWDTSPPMALAEIVPTRCCYDLWQLWRYHTSMAQTASYKWKWQSTYTFVAITSRSNW